MPKWPRLTAREIAAVLEKVGFSLARQSGSHQIYKNAAERRATVPFTLPKSSTLRFLKNTLHDAELSVEDLEKLL
jgi:predicted RNA binding protein YcfA (HicA-like mRNA interferase family)